jgi:excinuclease UvrABC nuclease subunit
MGDNPFCIKGFTNCGKGQTRDKTRQKGGIHMNFNDLIKISKVRKMKWHKHHIHTDVGGGIYRMFNIENDVIYVGKSVDLHRRLHEHYSKRSNTDYFIDEVTRHEVIFENDPVFLTLLESIFIAYHQPKYNDEVQQRGADNVL